jgi:archaellum component FlaC
MKFKKNLAVTVTLGAILLSPVAVLAEESDTAEGAAPPVPTLYRESPSRPSSGKPSGLPPGKPVIGNRMLNASGTKEMPKAADMRERAMNRPTSTEMGMGRGEEMREKMMEKRAEIMKRMIEQQVGRMKAMIDRLTKLADRLASRIAKLKERGVDTTKTESLLSDARAKIELARSATSEAERAAKDIIAGTTASSTATGSSTIAKPELGKSVRDALAKAREAVKAAHKALVEAISSLNASDKPKPTPATTTNATGTNSQ